MADSNPVLRRLSSESSVSKADAVVIGGGVIGLSTAFELASRGMLVVLVEGNKVGSAQSMRNWGFVRQQGRAPEELPLMIEANRKWRELEKKLDFDIEWLQGGNLRLTNSPQRAEEYRRWIDMARSFGLDSKIASSAEIDQIIPGFQGKYLMGIVTPSDGQANPIKVVAAYLRRLRNLGVEVYEDFPVDAIVTAAGRVVGVQSKDTFLATPIVVVAAGVGSGALLKGVGVDLPVQFVRQTVALTTVVPSFTQACVWTGEIGFRQARSGNVVLSTGGRGDVKIDAGTIRSLMSVTHFRHSASMYWKNREYLRIHPYELLQVFRGEQRNNDYAPNYEDIENSIRVIRSYFPNFDWDVTLAWTGTIDGTPDALPVIDTSARPTGLVIATGMSGHGFGIAPAIGDVVANLVIHGESHFDLSAFRIERFQDGTVKNPHHLL